MAKTNFLKETIDFLKERGKSESDVLYCDFGDVWFDFEVFKIYADFEYNAGFGSQNAPCGYIVGDNWWIERGEYDGSEWWEFKTLPKRPKEKLEDGAHPFKYMDDIQESYV